LGYSKGDLPISESLSNKIVSLPMHPYISRKDINSVQLIAKNK
jgi:dTDP-4-amino-4,6-dideoxygalactose transaminase